MQQEPTECQSNASFLHFTTMMSTAIDDVKKPISPKRAAAELEEVLSKSLFLTAPEDSDFDNGSTSINADSDVSRDSTFDWPHPERFRLTPRPAPGPRRILERSQSSSSTASVEDMPTGWQRPSLGTRSKSLGSVTSGEIHQKIRSKSLIDDDSATAASSAAASSASGGERFTFISNIGEVTKVNASLETKSIGSRKSRRSRQSRQSRQSRKSIRSIRSGKRGDSLEREISLTILQTAEQGADSAHFLVNSAPVVKSPVKSPEEILGDLFVSQDTSLEPISLHEASIEQFRGFFDDSGDAQLSPSSKVLFADEPLPSPSSEFAGRSPATEDALIATKNSNDSGSVFTFHPEGEKDDDNSEEDQGPSYATKYIGPTQDKKAAIISEAPSEDSLFTFSDGSQVTQDTARGKDVLFPEESVQEECPIGSKWTPISKTPQTMKQPEKASRLKIQPRPEFGDVSVKAPALLRRNSSADKSTEKYKIEMESSAGATSVGASRSFVSASDGAAEVQEALAAVVSPIASESNLPLNLEREDSFANDVKVAQEKYFLDKLVDIVQLARERPRDIPLADFYRSSSAESTDSTSTVEYPEDESPARSVASQNESPMPCVESQEKIDDDAHPDPELDDFLEEHGFGDSDSDEENEIDDDDDEWTAFDSSPFGVSRFASDEASGSTAPLPEKGVDDGKQSPESPTSITDFSTKSNAREKAKIIWWNRGPPDDTDVLSI